MAYIGTGIDPLTGLPYETGYVETVNVGYADPYAPGYVAGGVGLGGGYVETTTYTTGVAIDPLTGLPVSGGVVYNTF